MRHSSPAGTPELLFSVFVESQSALFHGILREFVVGDRIGSPMHLIPASDAQKFSPRPRLSIVLVADKTMIGALSGSTQKHRAPQVADL
jgi:hypothetical protein